ncbi:acyl-CoA N-acyltransferase [Naematelia encephala]|uniref:Acyl-CoA N-acyltransferase n=1 Tax=Naematelia encephala TaxID=71784 RepID=A0A1Y2BEY4_9TREE|nr:acyl-CoA N-acyltransferase [Naematelia encephala]
MSYKAPVTLDRVTPETLLDYAPRLAAIVCGHVAQNQSNNFLNPFSVEESIELFTKNANAMKIGAGPGGIIMWVAKLPVSEKPLESLDKDGNPTKHADIVGSVQLAFHMAPNGRFRSEVRKLIVDERYFRRGIGRTLMVELEAEAKRDGSTLCLLDTEADYHAEKLYHSMGWTTVGTVPNYALTPDGKEKRAAVFMYKEL